LKRFSAAAAALFLAAACVVFTVNISPQAPLFFDPLPDSNRFFFRVNFYLPLLVCALSLAGCHFGKSFLLRGLCAVLSAAAATIASYVLESLFTVNLLVYSAHVLVMAASFSRPKSLVLAGLSIVLFVIVSCRPAALGGAAWGLSFPAYSAGDLTLLALFLALLALAMIYARFLACRLADRNAMVTHLNQVSAKLTLFNHRLQELAKEQTLEIAEKERLKFTRDLHDSCGYAFTNIILVSDAAVSRSETVPDDIQDIFQQIRNIASKGLQDTRETLHIIRAIQEPYRDTIETISQVKSIFETVTDVKVDIEWGNIRRDYGPQVNPVIARIIQEAFTNSMRHGQATLIQIYFWEFPKELSMSVIDNGKGAKTIVKGIGFSGMEERLNTLGGKLDASIPPEGGFRLAITIPLTEKREKTEKEESEESEGKNEQRKD